MLDGEIAKKRCLGRGVHTGQGVRLQMPERGGVHKPNQERPKLQNHRWVYLLRTHNPQEDSEDRRDFPCSCVCLGKLIVRILFIII